MNLDDLKLPKEGLFKLTCRDRHDTPNYTFTWELTEAGVNALQEKDVRFPFMSVLAVEEVLPQKVDRHHDGCGCDSCDGWIKIVESELFCLHEGAGQIQFHRQGEFRIYAMILWSNSAAISKWGYHKEYIKSYLSYYYSCIINGYSMPRDSLPHVEEDAVKVTNTFFAKDPNPILWWWANLWWSDPPANSCDYKKRWFALPIEVPTVCLYAFFRGLLQILFCLGALLVGTRINAISLRPILHPFSSTFGQLIPQGLKGNYAFCDSKGIDRKSLWNILRIPAVWILLSIFCYVIGTSVYHNPVAWRHAVTIVGSVLITAVVGYCIGQKYLKRFLESRESPVVNYYTKVPLVKPKKSRVPMKVRWLDAKGKLCKPFSR